ncbi:MAG: GNAT family N-acetyltransferase [Alphaproteobacteria bacterium]|nr:GNAT family N-acetyltransferase [Alphaproteobacteria bacterium]
MTDDERRALEEIAARAWPHREELRCDGWLLRFSGGGSKRANSVQTLRWSGADTEAAIAAAEADYRGRGLTPVFQILDVSVPGDLDRRLERRGYRVVDRTLLMLKPVTAVTMPAGVAGHDDLPPEWLDVYLSTVTPDRRATAPAIIAGLPRPRRFLVASVDGAPSGVGLAVAEGRYCGIECMATHETKRGRGGGLAVLTGIEAWAAGQGATTLWLQVVETNAPARRLYEGAGFRAAGAYWYRVAPS